MIRRRDSRFTELSGAFYFLAVFYLFVRTHAPSLYLDDSGETVTVAALLGIGHPPGYPLHSLLSHLWLKLPLAGLPARLNLFGTFCGAAAATLLFLLLSRRIKDKGVTALCAAGLLACGPVFWHNALGAKGSIYQLNNLISVALIALLAWDEKLSLPRLRAFWLLFGLSLAHHYMSQVPLIPLYAWLLWDKKPWRSAWLGLLGPTLYAYLFIRSAQQPGLNWGDIKTWQDFWFFFFRQQYSGAEGTRSIFGTLRQTGHALMLLWREGFYVLLPAALWTAWAQRKERLVQALALGWLAGVASIALYLNLTVDRLDLMKPYLFPAYLCQAALAAQSFRLLAPWGLALPVAALAFTYPSATLSQYFYAQDNARNLLNALPPRALLFAQGDAVIFPLWYAQRVQGLRPDLAVVGNAVLPMAWVRDDLQRRFPDLRSPRVTGPVGNESVDRLVQGYAELNYFSRPLFTAYNKLGTALPGWKLLSDGPVYRLLPQSVSASVKPAEHLQASRIRGYTKRPLDSRTLTLIVGDFAIHHNSLGVALEEANKPAEARDWYQKAAQLHPESPEYPFNEGNAFNGLQQREWAIEAYQRAVAIDPAYGAAWFNLGVTHYQSGQRELALKAFGKVLALDPQREDVKQLILQLGGRI